MTLFLAPHHDDVLLSLPARVTHAARNAPLAVAVVYSEEDDDLQQVCRRLHLQWNVTTYELGFLEARRRGVRMRECLRRWRTAEEVTVLDVSKVSERLGALVEELDVVELVAPAMPVHLDHAVTRAAAESLVSTGRVRRLSYYADQPYASLWPSATALGEARSPDVSVARGHVVDVLTGLVPFVTDSDVRRILAGYGEGSTCRVEPLWPGDSPSNALPVGGPTGSIT